MPFRKERFLLGYLSQVPPAAIGISELGEKRKVTQGSQELTGKILSPN